MLLALPLEVFRLLCPVLHVRHCECVLAAVVAGKVPGLFVGSTAGGVASLVATLGLSKVARCDGPRASRVHSATCSVCAEEGL